ncbi:MAG: hypothetical protein ABIR30_04090 [Chitinophagaceae bacterium]
MKKLYLILSLVSISAWIIAVFLLGLSGFFHVFFLLSVLFYLRSLMLIGAGAASGPELESTERKF